MLLVSRLELALAVAPLIANATEHYRNILYKVKTVASKGEENEQLKDFLSDLHDEILILIYSLGGLVSELDLSRGEKRLLLELDRNMWKQDHIAAAFRQRLGLHFDDTFANILSQLLKELDEVISERSFQTARTEVPTREAILWKLEQFHEYIQNSIPLHVLRSMLVFTTREDRRKKSLKKIQKLNKKLGGFLDSCLIIPLHQIKNGVSDKRNAVGSVKVQPLQQLAGIGDIIYTGDKSSEVSLPWTAESENPNTSPWIPKKTSIRELPPSPSVLEHSIQDLDHEKVQKLLEHHFHLVTKDAYSWLKELEVAGYSMKDIGDVLLEAASDGPWIYSERSSLPSTHLPWKRDFHIESCIHGSKIYDHGPMFGTRLRVTSLEDREVLKEQIEELCGLAGVFPNDRNRSNWPGSVSFEQDDTGSIITYGSPMDAEDFSTPIITRMVKVLEGICTAVSMSQDAGTCCDRFTFIRRPAIHSHLPHLEMCHLPLDSVSKLLDQLKGISDPLVGNKAILVTRSLALDILSTLIEKKTESRQQLDEETSLFRETDAESIHLCCLAVQFISLAFLSYNQAHTGPIRPFFLDMPQRSVKLLGSHKDIESSSNIEMELLSLTCLDGLTREKVITFGIKSRGAQLVVSDKIDRYDLLCLPEDLIDTWGPGQLLIDRKFHAPVNVLAILLGGGTIQPTSPYGNKFHWNPGHNTEVSPKRPFSTKEKILVGAEITIVNKLCTNDEYQYRASLITSLEVSGTQLPSWDIWQKQYNVQAGQYVTVGSTWISNRSPGVTLKEVILQQAQDLNFLICLFPYPCGLQVSFCTSVARRVTLQQLLAYMLPIFVKESGTYRRLWDSLNEHHRVVDIFEGPLEGIRLFLTDLTQKKDLFNFLSYLIFVVLDTLKGTGVTATGDFKMFWPHTNDLLGTITVPIRERNTWMRMLVDSKSCATFAYIIPQCLKTSSNSCKGKTSPWNDSSCRLETRVGVVMLGTNHSPLKHSEHYYIGGPDPLITVEVHRPDPNEPPRLHARSLESFVSLGPRFLHRLRRRRNLPELREIHSDDRGEMVVINVRE